MTGKEFTAFMKVFVWIAVVMVIIAGLLGGLHPVTLVAGLAILGGSYWAVTTAFKAMFKVIEDRRVPPGSR
jgi:hypothetical protein